MADTKLSDLTSGTAEGTDIVYAVKDPSGTPVDRKLTLSSIKDYVLGLANTWTQNQTFSGGVNKVTITAPATGSTLTIAEGKTLTASNTLTFSGTDGSTLNVGTGGTLGALATVTPGTGVDAFLATPSSANLAAAVTDETGSGALVFATSPALTTPDLGTPSALTLTNATGLPVSGITASTSSALGVGSIELGHASDTTITRASAGVIAVEGDTVATLTATQTLTNKTLTSPTFTTPVLGTPSSGTLTSCTGLPISTGVSGLGTGVATAAANAVDGTGGLVTDATFAAASGKKLTASNTLTLAGTDGTTMTFPATSATVARTDAANTFTGVQTLDIVKTTAPTGGTAAEWKLGTVATVSPTSPNRTIEVEIGGTIYYLSAKTTND